ncbi:OLC1v1033933C1 [Oldenlandia corymbosa var. corymbosa]|uniref:OLC1v1033933C1 n=1 Tax=Oldenlandia corymbosa var. corymbosa TaxID=529605 RepID=A0AAV1CS07_OLDCO|nr:OLC1v1033933C1 [Oldenlandia corymbosa var. corymbosa]
MSGKLEATNQIKYEEFEPFCRWQREEARDTLIIDLPDFKKEQLRVHINNRGILKISGERSVDATKRAKFYKEVVVPKNCNTNGIQAKFASNHLHIIMPKLPADQVVPEQNKPQQQQLDASDNHQNTTPTQQLGSKIKEAIQSSTPKRGKELISSKAVVNGGMVMILMAAILAFVAYMYKSTIVED